MSVDSLTFAELRLASKLHKPTKLEAMAELQELARNLVPQQTLERFLDAEPTDAHVRLMRQTGVTGQLAYTLAGIVIQIDRFAALNDIDLAAAIRQRFASLQQKDTNPNDMEGQRSS